MYNVYRILHQMSHVLPRFWPCNRKLFYLFRIHFLSLVTEQCFLLGKSSVWFEWWRVMTAPPHFTPLRTPIRGEYTIQTRSSQSWTIWASGPADRIRNIQAEPMKELHRALTRIMRKEAGFVWDTGAKDHVSLKLPKAPFLQLEPA